MGVDNYQGRMFFWVTNLSTICTFSAKFFFTTNNIHVYANFFLSAIHQGGKVKGIPTGLKIINKITILCEITVHFCVI